MAGTILSSSLANTQAGTSFTLAEDEDLGVVIRQMSLILDAGWNTLAKLFARIGVWLWKQSSKEDGNRWKTPRALVFAAFDHTTEVLRGMPCDSALSSRFAPVWTTFVERAKEGPSSTCKACSRVVSDLCASAVGVKDGAQWYEYPPTVGLKGIVAVLDELVLEAVGTEVSLARSESTDPNRNCRLSEAPCTPCARGQTLILGGGPGVVDLLLDEKHYGPGSTALHWLAHAGARALLASATSTLRRENGALPRALASLDSFRSFSPEDWAATKWGSTLGLPARVSSQNEELASWGLQRGATASGSFQGDNGGWDPQKLEGAENYGAGGSMCEIIQVPHPPHEHALRWFIERDWPVIFRAAVPSDDPSRVILQRKNFLDNFGHHTVHVATIPYASVFGLDQSESTLLNATLGDDQEDPPRSIFDTTRGDLAQDLYEAVVLPPFASFLEHYIDKSGARMRMQLGIGKRGSGAPMHYHGPSLNLLGWGEKQWFFL